MTKKKKKLEQETNSWKGKYETATKSLTNILETVSLTGPCNRYMTFGP